MLIEHALEIFCDQVEFEVDQRVGPGRAEVRVCSGVGNNPNREISLCQFGYRKADSVDSDGTLTGDIMGKLPW